MTVLEVFITGLLVAGLIGAVVLLIGISRHSWIAGRENDTHQSANAEKVMQDNKESSWGVGLMVGTGQTFTGKSSRPKGEASAFFDEDIAE